MEKKSRITRRIWLGYVQFIEKHGLGFIVAACIAVIACSAAWTHASMPPAASAPVIPDEEIRSAADLLQESLADVTKPTKAPEEAKQIFSSPVTATVVSRAFDASRLQQSSITGLWRIHDAVDLRTSAGETIFAMADGKVISLTQDDLSGTSVVIDHEKGIIAYYMGMEAAAGLREGDPVSAGQVIGFAGSGMADEEQTAHLHLRVTKNGQAIDPQQLWSGEKE